MHPEAPVTIPAMMPSSPAIKQFLADGPVADSTDAKTNGRQVAGIPPPEEDPWKHKRVDWIGVVMSLMTYCLIVSDVPRAGTRPQLSMRRIGLGVYSLFGSFAYGVMTFSRDPINLLNLTATNGYRPVNNVRTWSYMYDTTSSGIRTVTRELSHSLENEALKCMNYESRCDPMGSLSLQDTFEVLDQVIDTVATIPEKQLPEILPLPTASALYYQHTRRAGLMKRRHTDILYEYLSYRFVDSIEISSFRITHFPAIDATFDPCAIRHDRPYLCDAGPLSDYELTADPSDRESVNVERISKAARLQALATYDHFHNLTENVEIDVTFFEGFSHPMTFTGGVVVSANADFEVVKLTRVRDCSGSGSNSSRSRCTTLRLDDYRFEGARVITDVDEWNNVIASLRIAGQIYFIVRIVGLFLGCYFAFPPGNRSVTRTLFLVFSEIPTHMVAYGSPLPILLYTIAMWIDGPISNTIVQYGGVRLQGTSLQNPGGIYRLICILMRRQWLMATIAIIWLALQTLSNHWNRQRGSLSVRGHVFSAVSIMSMTLGYHHPNFRDSRILEVASENPDIAVLNIGVYARDLTNQKLSGVYSDLIAMFCCGIVYVVFALMVRRVVRWLHCRVLPKLVFNLSSGKRRQSSVTGSFAFCRENKALASPKASSRSLETAVSSANGNRATSVGVIFCRTEALPSTCGTLWSHLGLTCGWGGDLILALLGQSSPREISQDQTTLMLMNIVQLTEPLNFLLLKFGFANVEVRTYRDLDSQVKFCTCDDLDVVRHRMTTTSTIPASSATAATSQINTAGRREDRKYDLVKRHCVEDLPFYKLVRCR